MHHLLTSALTSHNRSSAIVNLVIDMIFELGEVLLVM